MYQLESDTCREKAGIRSICELAVFTRVLSSCLLRFQAAYLLAFLMMLRIDEVVSLTFESLDKIPQEREWYLF